MVENIEKKIKINPFARTMRKGDKAIIGCIIGDGQWLKISSQYYDFLVACINNKMRVHDILGLCENNQEYEFYDDLLKKLFTIGVFSFEGEQKETKLRSLSLDLTSRCNLRCRHCSTAYGDIPAFDMPFDVLMSVVKWCEEKKVKEITLTGGEIFLLKDIDEKLRWIRSHYTGMIDIITNGTLICDEQVEILKSNVDAVNISLDGFNAQSTERIRGKGVYEKVIGLIEKLRAVGVDKISLSMVLTKENRDNIDKFEKLCEDLNVRPMPRTLNPIGRARNYYDEFKNEKFIIDEELARVSFRASCMAGYTTISSFSNGQIQPCAALDNDSYKMGNIQDLMSDTLWKPDLSSWCIVDKISICKDCIVRYFCASNCQAMNDVIYFDEKLREERCKSRKEKLLEAVWS